MASDDDEIPETGAIFTFGKTRFAENLANKFWIRDDKVLQLSCGDEHSAIITNSGRLYTFGSNDWGQLGHGNTKPYTKPSVVKKLKGDRVKVVACGRSHTLVISESGVFSFGAGADSQLGHGDNKSYNDPTEIEALSDKTIMQVGCGAEHSLALTDTGELYVWGSGSEGQLGLGISECELPTLLKFRSKVTFVSCGYYHTAVITELGKLYTFGDNEAGKLGLEDHQCDDTEQPQQVKTLNEPAVLVACGGNHTAVLTKRGSLFTFGSGMHGQLGHGPAFQDVSLPKLVSALQGKFVSAVSCGEGHTAVLTKSGEMFTFGDGRHGKLGMGDESFSNLFKPTKVGRFKRFLVEQVSCGGCHMLAVAARKQGDVEDSAGSEDDIRRTQEDSDGEDVPDGRETSPRLSQTIPMLGMSARDKRRKKDTEGVALASSHPPLSRSLPPLASLGIANMKKEETKAISNNRLNPLDRSTLPIISIKSPSPDEENSEKLSNSRRLPPRPKRRQRKSEPASDSEEEHDRKQRGNTTPRPTPVPRKQRLMKENQNNEDIKKSRKEKNGRDAVEKSGSEASDEESEEDYGNHARDSPSPLRSLAEAKEGKKSEASNKNEEEDSGEDSEDEESEDARQDGRQSGESGEENEKVIDKEKKIMGMKEEDEEDEESDEESDDEGDDEGDDDGESSKNKGRCKNSKDNKESGEETEVTKVEAVDSGKENDENENKRKENDKESKNEKKNKKEKKKGKSKEDEEDETEGKENEKGNKKDKKKNKEDEEADEGEEQGEEEKGKKKNKDKKNKNKKNKEEVDEGEEEVDEGEEEMDEGEEEGEEVKGKKKKKDKKNKEEVDEGEEEDNEKEDNRKDEDEETNKDEKGKKTKKSGICTVL